MNISSKAYEFAVLKHANQKRKNGEDYIVHPVGVVELLMQYKKSHNIDNLIAVAYLHDTLEDTETTYYELVESFGYEIASMVLELTTNEDMKNAIGKDKYLAYKLKHMTSWALAIKLCDRLHNISDIEFQDEDFRNKYSNETLFIIDYIIHNRELSNTHKVIIKTIIQTLETSTKIGQLQKV